MQILNNTRQLDIISIVGMPVVVNSTVINHAVVIQKEKLLGVAAKTYLPNYKEFYEHAGLLLPFNWQKIPYAYADKSFL